MSDEDGPPNVPTTKPDASSGPLLPPAPAGAEYFDTAMRTLLEVHGEQRQMFALLFDRDGPVQTLATRFDELEENLERRDQHAAETAARTEANVALVLDAVRGFRDDLLTLTGRVNGLDRRGDDFESRIKAISKTLDTHEGKIRDLERARAADTMPVPARPSSIPPSS